MFYDHKICNTCRAEVPCFYTSVHTLTDGSCQAQWEEKSDISQNKKASPSPCSDSMQVEQMASSQLIGSITIVWSVRKLWTQILQGIYLHVKNA